MYDSITKDVIYRGKIEKLTAPGFLAKSVIKEHCKDSAIVMPGNNYSKVQCSACGFILTSYYLELTCINSRPALELSDYESVNS